MKKGVLEIYLFRHGQTTYNRDGRFTGRKDAKLTKLGKQHARKIARELKNKKIDVAVHSHLTRSKNTLNEVLKFHPECKIILEDDRIIERGYGNLEGTSHEQFIDRIGKQMYDLEMHGDFATDLDKKAREKVEKFFGEEEYEAIHRGYDIAAPGGESFADVEKRVSSFIKSLKSFMQKEKTNVAISAHGNSIRLFRKIMEKASKEDAIKWVIPFDRVFTYKLNKLN